ncbi:LOW QUALITY PROTEIN: formin-J-like [Chelonus insularis]|uniref:LOW QUALITY PROTEIN: formin-J-like n=1 Tax=Chelonus insularis TaxID=460826 RepID=UPI001588BC95|nr:LOW QUALITY PROTEIN: formin-J-like [Chelonus insularis]
MVPLFVGLEATLSDSKKKYGDKVNALLSAWEHVTNFIPAATPEATQSLIEWVHKHTLKLVLRGEWPKLSPATKTHLTVTLQRCVSHLVHHPVAPKCTALISLVHNPWNHPGLDCIFNGGPDADHEDEFCYSEQGDLLMMRLKILCEERCEDIAVKLAAACVRSIRRSERVRSVLDNHQIEYMIDVYIVLLYKLKRTQDIFAQLKLMDLNDGLKLVQRLSEVKPAKYDTARVWRNSIKAAELVAQYLVTAGMVRPVNETGINVLEQILGTWAGLHIKIRENDPNLPGMIRKLIEPAESAVHIYAFCGVLLTHFGEKIKPLAVELYIRALTTDMNELETQKAKSDKDSVHETVKRLSMQFLKLADILDSNIGIARECVLTAFSLHPTRTCYDKIREMAVACGKLKQESDADEAEDEEDENAQSETQKSESKENCQNCAAKNYDTSNQLLKSLLTAPKKSDNDASSPKKESNLDGLNGQVCCNCNNYIKKEKTKKKKHTNKPVERTLDALILIKGDAVTGSANYDEKSVPNQVLDSENLGLSPQLCDDLAVVLSSPRFHILSWVLDWSELSGLCEKYLENAEEMRNTNKELKYLNIDYSQFKDWPSEDDTKDDFFGIEKGYEQWADPPSDSSEQYGSFQPAGSYKRSSTRRSLDDSSDSDSGSTFRVRRTPRQRKVHRLESSESDYDSDERKQKHFRNNSNSVSDSEDTNTQDSQTDSLGSDGFRRESKLNKSCNKDITKKREKSKLTVETVSHFHMLVENIRHPTDDVSGSDVSSNDIITLFSADMDENKRETIKASTYTAAAPLMISEKRRSDPAVLKSLRMFRPKNAKNSTSRITQILPKNILSNNNNNNNKNKDSNVINAGNVKKFAPMLSTLNLNPKIILTRDDEIDRKLLQSKKQNLNTSDISSELIHIQKTMPFVSHKNSIGSFHKRKGDQNDKNKNQRNRKPIKSNLGKNKFDILAKAVRDSDILTKNVPGMNSLDMMVPPRVQSTVNVVQISRNIPQSPNSGSVNSGNTPPRNRTSSIAGNIQLPGTPSSGGHDSGVGMSPAGQTPPPRTSVLHDVGEEANQPPDTSPTSSTNASTTEPDSPHTMNNQQSQNDSPNKSPSPSGTTVASVPITSEQLQIVCKPDGTYQLASVNPNVVSAQRNVLTLQNLDDDSVAFSRHIQRVSESSTESNRTNYERSTLVKVSQQQQGQNTGLPKFQQAFGKTTYTLSTDTTTVATSSTTETISQPMSSIQKTSNLSKAVQTSVSNSQVTTGLNVQSITNIPNLQLSSGRQILNIVQSSGSNTSVSTPNASQTLTQLVQNASPGGVIYTHKIPVTITTTNANQLNIIPTIAHTNSLSGGRTPVVKLNIIRAGTPLRQQNIAEAIAQAVLTAPRIQQQQQQHQQQQNQQRQQPQQQQTTVRPDTLLNSPIEVPNQVSSTTLEQLREFESVLEQVKERSTIQPQHQASSTTTTTVQTQTTSQQSQAKQQQHQQTSVSSLAQQLLISAQSSTNTEYNSNGNNTSFQQDVFPQKVSLTYVNQTNTTTPQKGTNSTPVVVVTSYCQPAASPALSVTSQSSSSPCVTPAPAPIPSSGKTPPTPSPKSAKKSVPKTVKTSATNTSKASPIPKPQQKPQEDEQTAQRIYTILAEYAEQLRNSPDLNNKPAPRRRSNPPTNPSQSSKRKKSSVGKSKPSGQQSSELSPSADDLGRTMGSEDSSSGIVHVQDSPAGFTSQDEQPAASSVDSSSETRNITNDSNDSVEVNVKRRNLIFTEPGSGQPRTVIVHEPVPTASVSISEALTSLDNSRVAGALASVGKVGSTAVFVPGTNYILPMNLVKGTQQFTIVSGGSKLLATVPATVRTSGSTGVSNTLVLQSFLNQTGKLISQPAQVKQVKLPNLQTLSTTQSLSSTQNASVVIPQTNTSTQFSSESTTDSKNDTGNEVIIKSEPTTPVMNNESTTTILVNKSPTIGILQRNINEITEGQQICGVITSNANLTIQGARLFNSTIGKLSTASLKDGVVCLTSAVTDASDKKASGDQTQGDKPVSMHGATIALAFATSTDVSAINNSQQQTKSPQLQQNSSSLQQKSTRETSTEIITNDKVISPKAVKKKLEELTSDKISKSLITSNSLVSPNVVTTIQNNIKTEINSTVSKQISNIDSPSQFLVSSDPGLDSQDSSIRQTNDTDSSCKVGNGVLCSNARLQEAWEPDRKSSPDTPWRYVPTSTNQLTIEPLKVYSRDGENSENVQTVLQIINKGQGIEMTGNQIYPANTKKYFINHTLEPFQQYSNKSNIVKNQTNNSRSEKELVQQRIERNRAAMERELRLQKSLSEECEDLGVDEPSTSDLFPEADLLFDTNHSPSFDHLSQDASCSQPLGMRLYNSSYFRPLDSSSGSRDTSPVAEMKPNERRRSISQRSRNVKDSAKRSRSDKLDDNQLENPPKRIKLSPGHISHDDGSNSNSDMSRLSLPHLQMTDTDSKDNSHVKMISRNGSKEGSPISVSSIPSNIKLDIDLDSESLPLGTNANNVSIESSGDDSLTLLGGNTANVTIPSPLSPIAGPLLSTHKYTYTNKKRTTSKVLRAEYLSWESPVSERTRSSSDEEDSSISESISSQPDDSVITNGLDDSMQMSSVKTTPDRCTYLKKKDKLQVNARVVLNRADPKSIIARRAKGEAINESGVMSSDKASEPSDDETCHTTLIEPDCRARRSSLRGHVKKGCACCNGSPERPKKKPIKVDHKLKKKLVSKQLGKKR